MAANDTEFTRISQGYSNGLTTGQPAAKTLGVRSGSLSTDLTGFGSRSMSVSVEKRPSGQLLVVWLIYEYTPYLFFSAPWIGSTAKLRGGSPRRQISTMVT
jgi:hypothetical protein